MYNLLVVVAVRDAGNPISIIYVIFRILFKSFAQFAVSRVSNRSSYVCFFFV